MDPGQNRMHATKSGNPWTLRGERLGGYRLTRNVRRTRHATVADRTDTDCIVKSPAMKLHVPVEAGAERAFVALRVRESWAHLDDGRGMAPDP